MIDELKNKMEFINKFMKSGEIVTLGFKSEAFYDTITRIEKDISDAINDISVDVDEKLLIDIKSSVNFLFNLYFEIPISPNFYEFVSSFIFLVINWNNNIGKDKELSDLAEKTDITYFQHHTIKDLLEQSKKILYLLSREQNYEFLSEMSRHYLKAFCDKEDKNG
jgi:hypothetical protein